MRSPWTPPSAYSVKTCRACAGEFFLLGGDDPYFTNVNANAGNQPYLSQDLRVFTITPIANNQTPIGNVQFTFQGGNPTTFDHPRRLYVYPEADHLA